VLSKSFIHHQLEDGFFSPGYIVQQQDDINNRIRIRFSYARTDCGRDMSEKKGKEAVSRVNPIVSSEHLASAFGSQMSEFEYGLITATNGFTRWMIRCIAAAGYTDSSPLDVLVLDNVNHRNRSKRLNDISFILHIEDQHTDNYSLKNLVKGGLVNREKGQGNFLVNHQGRTFGV